MNSSNHTASTGLVQRLVLDPIGLNSDNALVAWLLLIYSTITVWGLWFYEGEIGTVAALLYLFTIIILSFMNPTLSMYLLVFLVLLFDQYGIPGYDPITYQIDFFRNLKEISYLPFFEEGYANPIEIHLLILLLALLFMSAAKRGFLLRGVPVWGTLLLFFSLFLFSVAFGLARGGDFLISLWEIRAIFYFFIFYLIVPQLIRTRDDLRNFIWVIIFAVTFKALQGIWRFIELGLTTGGLATLTNHEDPVFMSTLFIFLLGLLIFKVQDRHRFVLLLLALPLFLGFYVSLRRAAYAGFVVSLVMFGVLLPWDRAWKYMKGAIPVLIFIVAYSAAFWNHQGTLGRPAQMIKSALETPTPETNVEDYYSNLYRAKENFNLAQTAKANPIVGIGFGKKYDQPLPLANIRFPLRDYIPHNEILWVLVKMGSIGFFGFWLFFNTYVARGTQLLYRLRDPYLQAVLTMIIIAIINQMVVSYFDLQLTYYRNMIYLGALMGLLPVIEDLADQENKLIKSDQGGGQ
ncbi:MAG: O-antigen ligase family protein [Bacteroidota bacterium]